MGETMTVKAAPGTKCPMEGKPKQYIGDTSAVDVPMSTFYRRLVADGSLVIAVAEKSSTKKGGAE